MPSANDLRVSIIVPGYNDGDYIARAIRSCMEQTHRNLQIICVNDGSADDTLAIMNLHASLDPRVEVVALEQNQGTHNARRAGLGRATGQLVMFLDGDDELAPDAARIAVEEFLRAPYDILHLGTRVQGDGVIDFARLRRLQRWMRPMAGEVYGPDIVNRSFKDHDCTYSIACKAYPTASVKEAFRQLGDVWCDAGEDALEYFAVASQAMIYRGLPERWCYVYHLGDGGSEHSGLDEAGFARQLRLRTSVDAIADLAERTGVSDRFKDTLDFHYHDQLHECVRVWVDDVDDRHKEACLRKLMEVWPQGEVLDELCTYGSPVMDQVTEWLGGDLPLTGQQLRAWGFADGALQAQEEYGQGALFRLGRAAAVAKRKAHTVLRMAGIEEPC